MAKRSTFYKNSARKQPQLREQYHSDIGQDVVQLSVRLERIGVKENSTALTLLATGILSNLRRCDSQLLAQARFKDHEVGRAHRERDIHITICPCSPATAQVGPQSSFLQEGLGGITERHLSPAKHPSVLCNQMVNFWYYAERVGRSLYVFSSLIHTLPLVKVKELELPEVTAHRVLIHLA